LTNKSIEPAPITVPKPAPTGPPKTKPALAPIFVPIA